HAQAAIRRLAVNACTVPQIVVAFGTRDLALLIGTALVRVGEIQAPVRVADHIVGPVETPAAVIVDEGLDLAVSTHPRQPAVIPFADDQTALQVEGRAIAADRR